MKQIKLLYLSGLVLTLLGLLAPGAAADDDQKGLTNFNITEIHLVGDITDMATIDLNGDGLKDIFLTCFVDDKANHRSYKEGVIFLQQKEKGFTDKPDIRWEFDPAATAVILGRFLPITDVQIGYLTAEGFYVYHPVETENPADKNAPKIKQMVSQKLFDTPSLFIAPDQYSLPIWREPIDIDNNGLDDVIVPEVDGYLIYFQGPAGKFTPCKIDLPADRRLGKKSSSFLTLKDSLPNISIMDINNDGLKDIVSFNKGTLSYYLQKKTDNLAERFTITPTGQVVIKSLQNSLQANEFSRVTVQVADINNDGLFDLLISVMQGGLDDLDKLRTQILVFWGKKGGDNNELFTYSDNPDQVINLKGVVPLVMLEDVNEDGKLDLITASFQMDFASNIQKAVLRYVNLTYRIQTYQNKTKQFSTNPDYERKINFPLDLIGKGPGYFSFIYFKDFDGDGRPDMLTVSGPDSDRGKVSVRLSRKRVELANPRMVSFVNDDYLLYRHPMPSAVKALDLNGDGKCDIILQYRTWLVTMVSR